MPTGHLRTHKRPRKDSERMRIAMEMQRPVEDIRCGSVAQLQDATTLATEEQVLRVSRITATSEMEARTTHETDVFGVPV